MRDRATLSELSVDKDPFHTAGEIWVELQTSALDDLTIFEVTEAYLSFDRTVGKQKSIGPVVCNRTVKYPFVVIRVDKAFLIFGKQLFHLL